MTVTQSPKNPNFESYLITQDRNTKNKQYPLNNVIKLPHNIKQRRLKTYVCKLHNTNHCMDYLFMFFKLTPPEEDLQKFETCDFFILPCKVKFLCSYTIKNVLLIKKNHIVLNWNFTEFLY
jgi:hypothetical protein